jgi:hypothetical protein
VKSDELGRQEVRKGLKAYFSAFLILSHGMKSDE